MKYHRPQTALLQQHWADIASADFRHGRGAGMDECPDILLCRERIVIGVKFLLSVYEVQHPVGVGPGANKIKERRKFEVRMEIHEAGQENGVLQMDDSVAGVFSDNFTCLPNGQNGSLAEYYAAVIYQRIIWFSGDQF